MAWTKFFRRTKAWKFPEKARIFLKNPLLLAITGRQAKSGHCSCPEICVQFWGAPHTLSHVCVALNIRPASERHLLMLKNDSSMYILKNYCMSSHMSKSSCMVAISSKRKKKSTRHSVSLNAETKLKVFVQLCWPCEIALQFFHFGFFFCLFFKDIFLLHPLSSSVNKQYHISFHRLQVNDHFNVTLSSEYSWKPLGYSLLPV